MAAGAEVVGGVDEATDFDVFLDSFHDVQGVFVSVCVGNPDDLFFRFYDVVTDEGDQLVQGGFAAPVLARYLRSPTVKTPFIFAGQVSRMSATSSKAMPFSRISLA